MRSHSRETEKFPEAYCGPYRITTAPVAVAGMKGREVREESSPLQIEDGTPETAQIRGWATRHTKSDEPAAEINVKVVVIHSREFKCGKQIKHLLTEFSVANYPT